MKNAIISIITAGLVVFSGCTKKTTIIEQYQPPAATIYGTWIMVNTNITDSTKNYLAFSNDGSNYFEQFSEDKNGFRDIGSNGVFSATNKQVIISSAGLFNYVVSHDSLILSQSAVQKIVALRITDPNMVASKFVPELTVVKSFQTMSGLSSFTYGFGFHADTMFMLASPFSTIRGYKYNAANKIVLDSWVLGATGSLFYNSAYIYHGYSINFRTAKREDKLGGSVTFNSANTLKDIRSFSMNTATNFFYCYQADQGLYTGIEGGTFSKVFDFSPYNPSNAVYHNSDMFLLVKNGTLFKVKIAPKFQVIGSYRLPANYDLNVVSSNGTDVWVYAKNNLTGKYEFIKVLVP